MQLSFESKLQLGLVGACAVITGLIIREDKKIKTEMAKLLAENGGFVEAAARVADALEITNSKLDDMTTQLRLNDEHMQEIIKRQMGVEKK